MITSNHCSARGRRNAAAGMGDLPLELAQSGDPGYGGVARKPPNGFGGGRSAPLALTRPRTPDTRPGIEAAPVDQTPAAARAAPVPRPHNRPAAAPPRRGPPPRPRPP